ncbi:MCE family protein [Phaeovibrio sulfidiphilus]|uniref:MCE family protein n=1 Tax=Phaeovibrio sulfidiphilus TaxID=1220600 RepID=A0A8J6YPF7_9PROT|nr:MlaD family protein [Phaeovibrio sulfidiphilus]MBE1237181.1 MCE family protein [Phaeovibrio sulfidiphilus]
MTPAKDSQKTLIGALVLALVVGMVGAMVGTRISSKGPSGVYEVSAVFNKADGIGLRSEVRLAGVRVGEVVGYRLDDHYRAVVTMQLDLKHELPDDTAAAILTTGLFGGKYIELSTGGGMYGTIPSGESLDMTQDSLLLEDLLEQIVALAKTRRGLDPTLPAMDQIGKHAPAAALPAKAPAAAAPALVPGTAPGVHPATGATPAAPTAEPVGTAAPTAPPSAPASGGPAGSASTTVSPPPTNPSASPSPDPIRTPDAAPSSVPPAGPEAQDRAAPNSSPARTPGSAPDQTPGN